MRVAICTPVARAPMLDYQNSLLKTASTSMGVEVGVLTVLGHANTPRARNVLAQQAIDQGFDEIVWIDDDIGWEPEAFIKLFDVPEEAYLVAGAPQRRSANPEEPIAFCGAIFPDGKELKKSRLSGHEGYWRSGLAATAFFRTPVSVFHELRDEGIAKHFTYKTLQSEQNPNGDCWSYFDYEVGPAPISGEPAYNGEDMLFSQRMIELGHTVWIDPSIRLRHWNMAPLTGAMEDFL